MSNQKEKEATNLWVRPKKCLDFLIYVDIFLNIVYNINRGSL